MKTMPKSTKNRNSPEFLQQMNEKIFFYKIWFEPMFLVGSFAVLSGAAPLTISSFSLAAFKLNHKIQ